MYASIDQAIDRVSRQMRKCHTRLLRRHRLRKQSSPSQRRFYADLFEEGYRSR
jgi:ribosome-associated translation inhibitor RaiA